MIIEGVIDNIIFRNDENGYTVAVLSCENKRETIVGKFVEIKEGENVRLDGNYVLNNKYGKQFAFDKSEIIEPSTLDGIEKYLSSGLIPGVGPVTAHSLVLEFGKDTLDMIEFNPERMAKVRGISEKKAAMISDSFSALKKLQRAVMFLQKYDITTNMAVKIYNIYGDKTVKYVEENPYKLVEDIDGIGFLTADKIASNMGISKDSEFRVRAGVLHLLNDSSEKSGNTFLPKKALFENLLKLLSQDKESIQDKFISVLQDLVIDKFIVATFIDGCEIVALSKFYNTELSLARKLATLVVSQINENRDYTSEINAFQMFNKIKFHSDQINAINRSLKNGVSVITGGPGTGKTTIVKCVIEILKQSGKKVLVVAPTGRAAKRLNETTGEDAKTIHRALELEFGGRCVRFKYNESNPIHYNCVIVDEVSMVDVMLMNSLLKALPRDAKLILVGDKDQLPSVGAGNVLADILKSEIVPTSCLTKIFRQEETSKIISNAHLINNGEMPDLDNSSSDFFFEQLDELPDIKNSVIALMTERIPSYKEIDISKIQVLAPLKAGLCGIDNLNRELQEKINPPSLSKIELTIGQNIFRVGDKVMQMVNNYDMEWKKPTKYSCEEGIGVFNGDIGFIHSIDYQTGETVVWFEDGREATYSRVDIPDLSLAYAITIHKSQGCEFDVVVMPIIAGASIILTRNLFYTAVTRAKKMVVLVGQKKNIRRMVSNNFTIIRYTMLKHFLLQEYKKMEEIYG